MRNAIGVLVLVFGVCLSIYLGFWLGFVGGVVQILEAIQTTPIQSLNVAIGLLRIMTSTFVFGITILITFLVGKSIIE